MQRDGRGASVPSSAFRVEGAIGWIPDLSQLTIISTKRLFEEILAPFFRGRVHPKGFWLNLR